MVSRVLRRKLRRDVWRQRWQFLSAALVIAIGVSVYVAASDAYLNLRDSFDRAYAAQRLPDVVISGDGAWRLRPAVATMPGDPVSEPRLQGDVAIRLRGHALMGRAVGVPVRRQPRVGRLALRSGSLPEPGGLVLEQHLADHYHLGPGDRVDVLGPSGWVPVHISGTALSTEYFWPARSMQELMTTPENFGVVFMPTPELRKVVPSPVEQLAVYATDRARADRLVGAARELAVARGLVATTREQQPSYHSLAEDVTAVGDFADLLPFVFLVAAVVGTYVLLSRLVAAQRAVIGTLAANGMPSATLRRHYLGYGVAAGLAGALPGLVGGYVLGGWFTTGYTSALSLPLHVTSVHPRNLAVAAVVGVAAAAAAAWIPARAAARTSPAEAMRIAPADLGRHGPLLARRLPGVHLVPARWRMMLRGILRNRRRTTLTVLGVALSVALVMVFAGLRDTVTTVIDRQFTTIQLEDAEVHVAPAAASTVLERLRQDSRVAAAEPFRRYDVTLRGPRGSYQTLLTAVDRNTVMHRFVGTDGHTLRLPADGILLGVGTRGQLGAEVGDRVSVTVFPGGRRLTERVAGFVDEPLNPVAYIALDHLPRAVATAGTGGILVRLAPGQDTAGTARSLAALPGVLAYLSTSSAEQTIQEAFSLYSALVTLMLVFAAVMAAALLYNAMSANVAERGVELGTLQAAGMTQGMLGRLVAAENLLLAVVGIPLGLLAGTWAARWFMSSYETQGYRWTVTMQPTTPLVVALGVLLAAVAAQWPAFRTLRRMDLARIVRERSL